MSSSSSDDAQRVQEIRARLEAATPGPWQALKRSPNWGATEIGAQLDTPAAWVIADTELRGRQPTEQNVHDASFIAHAREDVSYLLARLDALTAERDVLRVERDIARRVEQESSAAADAWQAEAVKVRAERDALTAERDARIKTLENDLEHALASVGAFRQAIEKVFAKADEHEIDQGGMIVTYVLPCGPLHRAIGLARGTDAGGKLLAERDALAARLAAAEAANARAADRIMQDVLDLDPDDPEHPDTICISYDALVVVLENALRGADAALAGSREQAV